MNTQKISFKVPSLLPSFNLNRILIRSYSKDVSNSVVVERWKKHREALREKFNNEPWRPRRRVSREAMSGIRILHQTFPNEFTTQKLGEEFQIGAEAIRRILRSKWTPDRPAREFMENFKMIVGMRGTKRLYPMTMPGMGSAEVSKAWKASKSKITNTNESTDTNKKKYTMERITLEQLKEEET